MEGEGGQVRRATQETKKKRNGAKRICCQARIEAGGGHAGRAFAEGMLSP